MRFANANLCQPLWFDLRSERPQDQAQCCHSVHVPLVANTPKYRALHAAPFACPLFPNEILSRNCIRTLLLCVTHHKGANAARNTFTVPFASCMSLYGDHMLTLTPMTTNRGPIASNLPVVVIFKTCGVRWYSYGQLFCFDRESRTGLSSFVPKHELATQNGISPTILYGRNEKRLLPRS